MTRFEKLIGAPELKRLYQQLLDKWDIAKQDDALGGLSQRNAFRFLLYELEQKIYNVAGVENVTALELEIEANPYESCIATVRGEEREMTISGKTRIVGTVKTRTGTITIFQRFIGKTFYQYVQRESQ